jgi:hypothetical protein
MGGIPTFGDGIFGNVIFEDGTLEKIPITFGASGGL